MDLAEACHLKTHKHTHCQLKKGARRKMVSNTSHYSTLALLVSAARYTEMAKLTFH